jgi:hypothetical protein
MILMSTPYTLLVIAAFGASAVLSLWNEIWALLCPTHAEGHVENDEKPCDES